MNRRLPEAAATWLRVVLPAPAYLALHRAAGYALALAWRPLSAAATLLLLPAVLWAFRRGGGPRPRLHPKAAALAALFGAALGLLAGLLPAANDAGVSDLLGLIAVGLSGPVCEEAVYRGMVLRRASDAAPPWAALLVSSALFAAGHGAPVGMAAALVAGFAFGGAYLIGEAKRPGAGLACAALCHITANIALLLRR